MTDNQAETAWTKESSMWRALAVHYLSKVSSSFEMLGIGREDDFIEQQKNYA